MISKVLSAYLNPASTSAALVYLGASPEAQSPTATWRVVADAS